MSTMYPVFEPHSYFCPFCYPSCSPLTFLSLFVSLLFLVQERSKRPGSQVELHHFLSMMTTKMILRATECPHSLRIQYSLQSTAEFQREPFKMPASSGSSKHQCLLYIYCHVFSPSIRKARNRLLYCPLFLKKASHFLLSTLAASLHALHGNLH